MGRILYETINKEMRNPYKSYDFIIIALVIKKPVENKTNANAADLFGNFMFLWYLFLGYP